jgi:hypothetical protein
MDNDEVKVPTNIALKRKLVALVNERVKRLGMNRSTYISLLVENDLVRGLNAPLSVNSGQIPATDRNGETRPRGIVVDLSGVG